MNFEKLEQVENIPGSIAKQKLLNEWIKEESNAEEYLRLVFNTNVYGLSNKTIEKALKLEDAPKEKDMGTRAFLHYKHPPAEPTFELYWPDFVDQLTLVKDATGQDLIDYLAYILKGLKPLQQKWLIRLLLKNMHCGVSRSTVNKVFKKNGRPIIRVFQVQLCGGLKDINKWNKFPCMACIKYDGFRAIIKKTKDKVTITSRQGKDVTFVPEIIGYFSKFDKDFVLDGEILADNFSLIQKRIGKKLENIEPVSGLHFRCFDMLEYDGMPLESKRQVLRTDYIGIKFKDDGLFKLEEYIIADNIDMLKTYYKEACDAGEEGIIIKELDATYEYGSRSNWTKVKPIFENTFRICNHKLGTGKNKDVISALMVEDYHGRVRSWVGSGLKETDIDYIMQLYNNNLLIGMNVEIQYNEVTRNAQGDYSLRFPRFLKFRDDISEPDVVEVSK